MWDEKLSKNLLNRRNMPLNNVQTFAIFKKNHVYLQKKIKTITKMETGKTGIVLEGGGMRGMYTCGILDVLMEQRIYVDGMIGVSAGIAFGCNYKSRQVGRALRYNVRFARDKRYSGILIITMPGLLTTWCPHTMTYLTTTCSRTHRWSASPCALT